MYDRYRIKGKKHNILFDINISEANKYFFFNLLSLSDIIFCPQVALPKDAKQLKKTKVAYAKAICPIPSGPKILAIYGNIKKGEI